MKPFAESCEENKLPILAVLEQEFADAHQVLEIGSGTGQHACFFGAQLPHLQWQTSDVTDNHPGILAWLDETGLDNIAAPLALDVLKDPWPDRQFDAVFSANTLHIMNWPAVEATFAGIGKVLVPGGRVCIYGPFNYGGEYTSESNARFDQWLKSRDPESGIRHFEDLEQLAKAAGLTLHADHTMPANNRILVWKKSANRE